MHSVPTCGLERKGGNDLSPLNVTSEHHGQQLEAKIIKWAYEIKAWGIEWHTGIYPGEMAAFLGLCDLCGVRSIIESGRGEHAYSTQILGEYAERTGVKVVSIDFSPPERNPFHERLQRYPNLRCVAGDTFDVLPDAAYGLPGPVALLLDGPKMQPANRLSLVASIVFDTQVVAHHNCHLFSPWGKEFTLVFPGTFHFEDLGLAVIPKWQEFKRWEKECVGGYEQYDEVHELPGRSLRTSSLAMASLSPNLRSTKRLLELQSGPLCYNPLWLWVKWSIFLRFRLTRRFFRVFRGSVQRVAQFLRRVFRGGVRRVA